MMSNINRIKELAKTNQRLDMRALDEYRKPIDVKLDISWTAEGSAQVTIGDTVVLAGVKLSLEKPYNDTPNQGGIMINAELTPLSSSQYEPGPPGMKAIELARVTDRGIREAQAINLKKLCVVPGEKAWFVSIDIVTLNDAGNVQDAASLAALAALKTARYPKVDPETGAINYKEKTDQGLPIVREPLGVTVYKINGALLVDPSSDEEQSYDARLTVATDENGIISAMQKGGEGPLTIEEVGQMVELAQAKSKYLREELIAQLK